MCFGLWELRSELAVVANTDDGAMHSEMVRFALARLRAGHSPLTSWFPYLGLGSPQFMHYQSLGAIVTAVIGLLTGANRAFSLTLYLLLSSWPLCIYWSARMFRLDRWAAAGAALCAPFVLSNMGIGYEEISYTFVGFGLWSQLWGMWSLPLAWATSWRTVNGDRRFLPAATVLIALTIGFHFMTGYLALMVVPLWAVVGGRGFLRRALRAGTLLATSFLCAAWAIVPLLVFRPWASVNEALAGGPDARSYGAETALTWLFDGRLLDNGRWPVLTALAAFGLASAVWRFRREEAPRALLAAGALSLLLFFGRPTWGSLMNLLPGSTDLFLRRFVMGVQLASILFAGMGLATLGRLGWLGAKALTAWARSRTTLAPSPALAFAAVAALVGAVGLSPAWRQVQARDDTNASFIAAQQKADTQHGPQLATLVHDVKRFGGWARLCRDAHKLGHQLHHWGSPRFPLPRLPGCGRGGLYIADGIAGDGPRDGF